MWGSFIYEWVSVREKYTNTRVFISSSVGHTCLGVRYAFFFQTFYFVLRYSWLTMLWYFQGAANALSHPYTCIHSPPNCRPIQAATWHWAEFPVLSSGSLLVLHDKYSTVSTSIPDSLTNPSPILPPGDRKVITEYWADFPGLTSRPLLVLHVKYSSVSMSIPDSLTLPSPNTSLSLAILSLFFKSLSLFLFYNFTYIISF